jgi:hypothetical protein
MHPSAIIGVVSCWVILAGLDVSNLPTGIASVAQESSGTSGKVGQGTVGEPGQVQSPPIGEPPPLSEEERQRLEQAVEGTHLPGPKPSRDRAVEEAPGPHVIPTFPRTLPEPDEGGKRREMK